MFTDETLDGIECKSTWKKERSLADSAAQTRDQRTEDVGVQAIDQYDEEVQTDEVSDKRLKMASVDSQELVAFIREVEPYILKQLALNLRSHAFDGYDVSWEEATTSVTSVHTLNHADFNEQMQVTGLTWNSTGSVIAGSYGRLDHEDWCVHKSALCTWNLDRRTINEKKPDTVIDLSSCLMCIAFHPKNPAWIAGGTFNGEVLLWDMSREDDMLIASSGIGDDSHREPVSKVLWIPDPKSKGKRYQLVSASGDGKMLVWKYSTKHKALQLIDGFVLMTDSLPRRYKVKGVRGNKEMGVTSISYNHEDKDTFIIGSESGGVFKCSMHAQGTPAGENINSSVPLRSPVTLSYNPHHGPVYAVDCSPYHRNAFVTSAMDQSIRIYNMLQAAPVITMEPGQGYLYSAKWSPVRPLVLAVTSASGHLLIYDLKQGKMTPVHKLEASPKKVPVFSLQFNQHQHQLVATGDGCGYIQVFRLSDELTSFDNREAELLGNMLTTQAE